MDERIQEKIDKELRLLSNKLLSTKKYTIVSSSPIDKLKEQVINLKTFIDDFNKEATPLMNSICKEHAIINNNFNNEIIKKITKTIIKDATDTLT